MFNLLNHPHTDSQYAAMLPTTWFLVFLALHSQTYHRCAGQQPPVVSCDDDSAVSDAFLECFRNARVEISADAQITTVANIFFYPLEFICNQKANMKAGANCGLEIERQCNGRENVPTSSSMEAVIDDLCQNQQSTNINDTCRIQLTEEYWNCVSEKERPTVCSGFEVMNECFRSEYINCGCSTAQIFSSNFIDLIRSTSCSVASMTRVTCRRDGGASFARVGLLFLVMANFVCYCVIHRITKC